jgi:hypothetical protein
VIVAQGADLKLLAAARDVHKVCEFSLRKAHSLNQVGGGSLTALEGLVDTVDPLSLVKGSICMIPIVVKVSRSAIVQDWTTSTDTKVAACIVDEPLPAVTGVARAGPSRKVFSPAAYEHLYWYVIRLSGPTRDEGIVVDHRYKGTIIDVTKPLGGSPKGFVGDSSLVGKSVDFTVSTHEDLIFAPGPDMAGIYEEAAAGDGSAASAGMEPMLTDQQMKHLLVVSDGTHLILNPTGEKGTERVRAALPMRRLLGNGESKRWRHLVGLYEVDAPAKEIRDKLAATLYEGTKDGTWSAGRTLWNQVQNFPAVTEDAKWEALLKSQFSLLPIGEKPALSLIDFIDPVISKGMNLHDFSQGLLFITLALTGMALLYESVGGPQFKEVSKDAVDALVAGGEISKNYSNKVILQSINLQLVEFKKIVNGEGSVVDAAKIYFQALDVTRVTSQLLSEFLVKALEEDVLDRVTRTYDVTEGHWLMASSQSSKFESSLVVASKKAREVEPASSLDGNRAQDVVSSLFCFQDLGHYAKLKNRAGVIYKPCAKQRCAQEHGSRVLANLSKSKKISLAELRSPETIKNKVLEYLRAST